MTIGEIYQKIIELGKKADPRSAAELKRFMKARQEDYQKIKSKEEKDLLKDKLWNPYDDSRVVYGDLKRKVKVVFVGIDIGTPELTLISQLNAMRIASKKKPIDLAMSHHPEGHALGGLSGVMEDIQVEILRQAGVPVNITEKVISSRVRDVAISVGSNNLYRTKSAAELLDIPLLCCHTAADNNAYQIIKKEIERAKPYRVKDVVEVLQKIPVYKKAASLFERAVDVQVGSADSRAGKVIIGGFTGGTDGNPDILEYLVNVAGVGTTVDMHVSPKHRELAEKHRLNVVVANHMASDSLGMQVIVNMLSKNGLEVVTGSGFISADLP